MTPRGSTTLLVILVAALVTSVPPVGASRSAPSPLAPRPDAYVFRLIVGGRARDYRLHVPPAAADGSPRPLVVNLHGATQNAVLQEAQSGMDAAADRDGFLVAYPDGTRISTVLDPDPVARDAQYGWNAGHCCGLPVTKHVDDVTFLLRAVADVAAHTPVDLRRVYATGMSNGGMMAYSLAARAAGHFAAISSVAGQVEESVVAPSRPVPTLEFHSADDPVAKWQGVAAANPRLRFSVMQGIATWVRADGCEPTAHEGKPVLGAVGSPSAGETATLVRYRRCRSGAEVSLWRFTGSGHVWPGSTLNTGPESTWLLDGVGRGTTLVDANATMWQFFRRFSLPAAASVSR